MKRYWYAFMEGLCDNDWGTGTNDVQEALDKLNEWKQGDYSGRFIDIVDDDQVTEPMSVAHIGQDEPNEIWEYEKGNYNRVYVYETYRDKGGCGNVFFYDRPEEALKVANEDWNRLNEHDKNSYDLCRVYEIALKDEELAELNDPLGEVDYQAKETRELKDYTEGR